jgi:hypothetical protein
MQEEQKHVIVGGGVAGIYLGMQLYLKNEPFIILEQSGDNDDRIGKLVSKVKSIPKPKTGGMKQQTFELGASIFHSNQTEFIHLLKFLGLDDKIIKFDSKMKSLFVYPGMSSEAAQAKFLEIKNKLKRASFTSKYETIDQVAKRVLTTQDYDLLATCWNCWYENNQMNAKTYFDAEAQEGQTCMLRGGLEQITTKARAIFKDKYKCYHTVKYVDKLKDGKIMIGLRDDQDQAKVVFTDNIYLCLSVNDYSNIRLDNLLCVLQYIKYVHYLASLRFYVVLKEEPPNSEYDEIVGDIESKWILKYNKYVWLGPYVDGELADVFRDKKQERIVLGVLRDLGFENPSVESQVYDTIGAYWMDAFEVLRPQFFAENPRLFRLEPGVFCTSVPQPKDQAWMNGHLFQL